MVKKPIQPKRYRQNKPENGVQAQGKYSIERVKVK
jgi:hypothetical protein